MDDDTPANLTRLRAKAECAVVAIRVGGHATAEIHFPVGPA